MKNRPGWTRAASKETKTTNASTIIVAFHCPQARVDPRAGPDFSPVFSLTARDPAIYTARHAGPKTPEQNDRAD